MKSNIKSNSNENELLRSDETLKATALFYLRDALATERFEEVPELIQSALRFGAKDIEVKKVIARYLRDVKFGPQNAQKASTGGRARF